MIIRLQLLIFILVIKSSNCQVASNRVINIQNLTQCINPLKDEESNNHEPMQAPYFLVPIQPDDLDSLGRQIHFDIDSGQVCFLPEFRQVKFTTLSINQGLALNLEINLIDSSSTTTTTQNPPKQINITHLIPKLSHRNSARLVFTCTQQSNPTTQNGTQQIDQHLFYIEHNDNLNTSNTNFLRLVNSVSQTETNVVIECPNESVEYTYTLRLAAPDENYFLKSSSNQNVVFQLRKPLIQTSTSSPAAHQQITKTAAKLAKLTFNLKVFTILALTLASLLAVLIYIVFLTLTRLMRAKAQLFSGSNSCGTMDTHSSIIMSDLPTNGGTSGENCFFKSSRCYQLDLPTSEMFKHSSVYLGQLGIDAGAANLKNLIDDVGGEGEAKLNSLAVNNNSIYKPNMYVTNGSATSMDLSGTRACVQQRWQRMLDWNVDFNSMSDVFHDLARFK